MPQTVAECNFTGVQEYLWKGRNQKVAYLPFSGQ